MDFGLRTLDYGLRTMDYGRWTTDFGLWTLDYGLWTTNFGIWNMDFGLQTMQLFLYLVRITCEIRKRGQKQILNITKPDPDLYMTLETSRPFNKFTTVKLENTEWQKVVCLVTNSTVGLTFVPFFEDIVYTALPR